MHLLHRLLSLSPSLWATLAAASGRVERAVCYRLQLRIGFGISGITITRTGRDEIRISLQSPMFRELDSETQSIADINGEVSLV